MKVRACAIDFGAHTRLPGPHACRSTEQDAIRQRQAALHEMPSPMTRDACVRLAAAKAHSGSGRLGERLGVVNGNHASLAAGGRARTREPKSGARVCLYEPFARANLLPRLVVRRQIRELGPAAPASVRPVHSGSPARIGGGASPRLKILTPCASAKKAAARRLRSGERQ